MRKSLLTVSLILGTVASAHAGGFLTNTNQSVVFLRNPARDASIAIDAAYANPAGIGFMNTGWHLGLIFRVLISRVSYLNIPEL